MSQKAVTNSTCLIGSVIPEIKPLLTALTQADFHISEKIIQQALRLAGESD